MEMKNVFRLIFWITLFVGLSTASFVLISKTSVYAMDVTLAWDPNSEPYLGGYKVYYNSDGSGPPYDGTGALEGDSPIDVGNITEFTLYDLLNDNDYWFVVTAYSNDDPPLESDYSNEVTTFDDPSTDGGSGGGATGCFVTTIAGGEN